MKRVLWIFVAFVAMMFVTVSAQAESKGEQVFNQKCAMCHQVKGKGGSIGPELTKVASRIKDAELKAQIENPKKRNASTSMPSFKTLPKAEMDAVLGYLKTLK
jgi:cytochrome c2